MLQKMGLTLYGAKVYAALVSTGSTNATVLANEAEVPRTKIYETLKLLEKENWVIVEKGRPNIYAPRHPKDIIEERKLALYSDIDKVCNQLTMTYDRLMEKERSNVWLIRGIDNAISKSMEMMNRAQQGIMLFGTLYSPKEIELLKKQISMAKKRGVSVRVITGPTVKTDGIEINIIESLLSVTVDIKILPLPYIKGLIIDNKEVLVTYSRVDGDAPNLEDAVALWIAGTSMASYMASNFNMMWNMSSAIDAGHKCLVRRLSSI